jgi:hypothetical protein
MKVTTGAICLVKQRIKNEVATVPYGMAVKDRRGKYESLTENGFQPFRDAKALAIALAAIRRSWGVLEAKSMLMTIIRAESEPELHELPILDSLIVIGVQDTVGYEQWDLYGPAEGGKKTHFECGADYMWANGFKPFTDMESARRCRDELRQIPGCEAWIASLEMAALPERVSAPA